MNRVKRLDVLYHDRPVGTLAALPDGITAFEYSSEWIQTGFAVSPLSLPLRKKVYIPKPDPFDGVFGVFADSMPDGWGRLLVDRLMRRKGIDPGALGNLDRLAIVGAGGMGALTYRPSYEEHVSEGELSLDEVCDECKSILNSEPDADLDYLFLKGGSSGGARPKILTKVGNEDWIIKFPSSSDSPDIGVQEYDYSQCAVKCGIEMEETRLFPSERTSGFFGTKRFDRTAAGEEGKVHMVSASGLLETSHRIPNLDYNILMRLTLKLTKSMDECGRLFRLMCFNVYAHNRDDHSKNFTYVFREDEGEWRLSPAYDLTYSDSIGGEHATTVNGNGRDPGIEDILAVARNIGLNERKARSTALEIRELVYDMLGNYLKPSNLL